MAHTHPLFVSHSIQGEAGPRLEDKQSSQEMDLDNFCLADLSKDEVSVILLTSLHFNCLGIIVIFINLPRHLRMKI